MGSYDVCICDQPPTESLCFWPRKVSGRRFHYTQLGLYSKRHFRPENGRWRRSVSLLNSQSGSDINVRSSLSERTKNRPLASGRVSVFAATVYLVIQYIIGIGFFYITVHGVAYALFVYLCPVVILIFAFSFWVALFQLLPLWVCLVHIAL